MFEDAIKAKALLIGFLGYLLVSAVAMAIIIHLWMQTGVTDAIELSHLAETDPQLLASQSLLGAVLGVLAGFAACHFSGARGLKNSLVLGIVFALYGVLGIFMHPAHPIYMQIGKLLSPVPLVLLGGWLRLAARQRGSAKHT